MSNKTPTELINDAHERVRKQINCIENLLNKLPCEKCSIAIARDNTDPHRSTLTSLEWRSNGRSKKFRFFIDHHGGGQGVDMPLTQADAETMFKVVEPGKDKDSLLQKLATQIKDQRELTDKLKRFSNAEIACKEVLDNLGMV